MTKRVLGLGFVAFLVSACVAGVDEGQEQGEDTNNAELGAKGGKKCNDPSKTYVSRSPDECALIHFFCEPGYEPFFNSCGCGCQPTAGEPCNQVTCGAGEFCCNLSCSICAPEGGFCTQQFCESI